MNNFINNGGHWLILLVIAILISPWALSQFNRRKSRRGKKNMLIGVILGLSLLLSGCEENVATVDYTVYYQNGKVEYRVLKNRKNWQGFRLRNGCLEKYNASEEGGIVCGVKEYRITKEANKVVHDAAGTFVCYFILAIFVVLVTYAIYDERRGANVFNSKKQSLPDFKHTPKTSTNWMTSDD